MKVSSCRAEVPANCRYHGYGANFEPEIYEKIRASVERVLSNTTSWATSTSNPNRIAESDLPALLERTAKSMWEQAKPLDNRLKRRKKALAFNLPVPEDMGLNAHAAKIFNASTDLTVTLQGGQEVHIKEVTHAAVARNACAVVSMKLVDVFGSGEQWGSDTDPVVVRRDAPDSKKKGMFWHHAAIQVTKDNEPWVIDYTIRQFNKKLPFPYVGKLKDWEDELKNSTGEQWVEDNLTDWTVTTGYPKNSA